MSGAGGYLFHFLRISTTMSPIRRRFSLLETPRWGVMTTLGAEREGLFAWNAAPMK